MVCCSVFVIALMHYLLTLIDADLKTACGEKHIEVNDEPLTFRIPPGGGLTEAGTCHYLLTGWDGTQLTLFISDISLVDAGNCTTDYIKVAVNESSLGSSQMIACEQTGIPFTVAGSTMAIELKVSHNLTSSFVELDVLQTVPNTPWNPPACGSHNRIISSTKEVLRIPEKGFKFEKPTLCRYDITGSDNQNLGLYLETINIVGGDRCSGGFLLLSHVSPNDQTYSLCDGNVLKRIFLFESNEASLSLLTVENTTQTQITGIIFKGSFEQTTVHSSDAAIIPTRSFDITTDASEISSDYTNIGIRIQISNPMIFCTLLSWSLILKSISASASFISC